MKKIAAGLCFASLCFSVHAQSLETYNDAPEVHSSTGGLWPATVIYVCSASELSASVQNPETDGNTPLHTLGQGSGSVWFISNTHYVYTGSNSETAPPTTLYIHFGGSSATELATASTTLPSIPASAKASVGAVSSPPAVTAIAPSLTSYLSINPNGGTGGATATASVVNWNPVWTLTAPHTWTTSECKILSPLASTIIAINKGSASAWARYSIPWGVLLTP